MKGSFIGFVVAGLGIMGAASLGATGCSSSSGGGTPSGTYCHVKTANSEVCTGASGGSGDTSQFTQMCTQEGGTIVSSCPTTNSLGCCTLTNQGVSASSCTYCPSALTQSQVKSTCTSPGSGATATFAAGDTMTCSGGGGGDASAD